MRILSGRSVCGGISTGVLVYRTEKVQGVECVRVEAPEREEQRYHKAVEAAERELNALYAQCLAEAGEESAAVFQAQIMLMKDRSFQNAVCEMIKSEGVNAEFAVQSAGNGLAEVLAALPDEYIRERAEDIREVADRIVRILQQGPEEEKGLPEAPFILLVEKLSAGELVRLAGGKLCGLVLANGSMQSHVAILARGLGIPTMVYHGEVLPENGGDMAFLDGGEGILYVNPDQQTCMQMEQKRRQAEAERESLQALKGKKAVTGDGRSVRIYANAGSMADVNAALENDAGGIGLLRSEVLYLEGSEAPEEEVQFAFYKEVLERMEGREVIIRTFDMGADKQPVYMEAEREENPALGVRGIRLALKYPELLKIQLKALFRAGVYGRLGIMYPMISTIGEVEQLKALETEAKHELEKEGKRFASDIPVGIMIETPAAALLSEELAKKVSFFSVGTNDLTQYTYAWDRQNGHVCGTENTVPEAVFRLVEMAAKSAHRAGIWIGVCGEMAANPAYTERFLDMGIDELSVAPGEVLKLRGRIRKL